MDFILGFLSFPLLLAVGWVITYIRLDKKIFGHWFDFVRRFREEG